MVEFASLPRLCQRIDQLREDLSCLPLLVLIGGCSRSGKSTLAQVISDKLTSDSIENRIINLDAWLVSVEKRKPHSTVLERYDCHKIVNSITGLLQGQMIYPPVYDLVTRQRIAENNMHGIVIKSGVVIVDGVISLALSELIALASLKIYVQVPDEIRLKRLYGFYRYIKALSNQEIEAIISERENEEIPFIKNTSSNADFIIYNC